MRENQKRENNISETLFKVAKSQKAKSETYDEMLKSLNIDLI